MEIGYKKRFLKQFKKLSPKIKDGFYERLALFRTDRFNRALNNHSVDRAYPGCRSMSVTGDYRAIYREKDGIVIFITIGTHPELYS